MNFQTPGEPTLFRRSSSSQMADLADILTFVNRLCHIVPDEPQRLMLTSTAKRAIVNCSRQWGKSTIAAVKALHRAYVEPEITVLIASPGIRQSGEFLMKAEYMLRKLGIKPRGDGVNEVSILLPNGSRIVGLPGLEAKVRCFSTSLLIVDEASEVPDQLYLTLRPMLAATNGDLWLLSTPKGKRGFFYETWQYGGPGWQRFSVPATICPRISKEFLEEERSSTTADHFEQEFMCQFVGVGGGIFDRDLIDQALDDDTPILDLNIWKK